MPSTSTSMREILNYRVAVRRLGQLEDLLGNNEEWLEFEKQFNQCVEGSLRWPLFIVRISRRLDELHASEGL